MRQQATFVSVKNSLNTLRLPSDLSGGETLNRRTQTGLQGIQRSGVFGASGEAVVAVGVAVGIAVAGKVADKGSVSLAVGWKIARKRQARNPLPP